MKKLRVPRFSFHTEPFWIWMSGIAPVVLGIMIALLVVLVRKFVL